MTQQGTVDIEDVKKLYEELPVWDKKKFILDCLDEVGIEATDVVELKNSMVFSPYQAYEKWGYHSLMDEIPDYEIGDYIRENNSELPEAYVLRCIKDACEYDDSEIKRLIDQRVRYKLVDALSKIDGIDVKLKGA